MRKRLFFYFFYKKGGIFPYRELFAAFFRSQLEKILLAGYIIRVMKNEQQSSEITGKLTGTEIDGFLLEAVLGSGSYGVVYRARHLLMDKLFALKVLMTEFASDEARVKEFFRESKIAARLEHPNIVQAIKAGRTDTGLCYFVMEYVDGMTIEDIRIKAPERLSLPFLLGISIQLADALDYAWNSCRIIHRDIKPGNLLIREADNQLKLADLGLAGAGSVNQSGDIFATPLYMAPEVAAGLGSRDVTGDIYSFGVMFYELSAGIPPFSGTVEELQRAHVQDLPPPLLSANPDLDPELAGFIDSLLAKSPADRPQSWALVKERLSAIRARLCANTGQKGIRGRPEPEAAPVERERERKLDSLYIGIVVALVLILGAVTAVCLRGILF